MTKTVQIAPDLKLPLDTVVQRKTIIAKNRAGKSNTGCVYVEEVHKHGVQSIILDPKGDWYGIRSSSDGKGEGLPFLVMGGDHGDIPLDPSAGKDLGEYLGTNHVDVVLDVSEFSKAELARFGADFLEALYAARKRNRSPLNLVLEEADDFAPQQIEKWAGFDLPRCLGAVIKIAKKAGFLGIGLLLITQRTASLNKNVLSQSDGIFFMRTTAPQDLKAADAWLQNQDDDKRKEVLSNIQGLPTGAAYVWFPEAGLFKKVQLRRRETFDAGFTPKVGESRAEPKVRAKVDLEALQAKLAAVVEKAKADDPTVLKAKIRKLEAELGARKPETVMQEKIVERSVLTKEDQDLLSQVQQKAVVERSAIHQIWKELDEMLARISASTPMLEPMMQSSYLPKHRLMVNHAKPKPVVMLKSSKKTEEWSEALGGPHKKILDALAWFEAIGIPAPQKEALAFKAGYRPGGGAFNNPLGALRNEKGNQPWPPLISYGHGTVSLTAEGRDHANEPSAIGTADELQQEVLQALDGPMAKILAVLLETYPKPISKEDLAARSGYAEGGGAFNNPLGRLRTCGLIDYPERGMVVALPLLFLEA